MLENLSTHTASAFYEAFAPEVARRLAQGVELCYTTAHGCWMNMAQIEISALVRQCLKRGLPEEMLRRDAGAWAAERNRLGRSVEWCFTTGEARIKLRSLYPAAKH